MNESRFLKLAPAMWLSGLALLILALAACPATADTIGDWDFTQGQHGWTGNAMVANSKITALGWEFDSTGNDPWLNAPTVQTTGAYSIVFTVRMSSTANAVGRIYWGAGDQSEPQSTGIDLVADGEFHEFSAVLPPLDKSQSIRFDPATSAGHIVIQSITIETAAPIDPPPFEPPHHPEPGGESPLSISSGSLSLTHYRQCWGGWVVAVGGAEMAASQDADHLGFIQDGVSRFVPLRGAVLSVGRDGNALVEAASFTDDLGGSWTLTRRFTPAPCEGAIDVRMRVRCDQTRSVIHVPWMTLFPGLGAYGAHKTQGMLAGTEYLADEPSSSKADLTTADSNRLVPDPQKLTFPLMALSAGGKCLGLSWTLSDMIAAVHDSPDRVYGSAAHLWGLWAPAVGPMRRENDLFATVPFALAAGETLQADMTLLGAPGDSVVPAVRQYIALRGLPAVPQYGRGFDDAVELLAVGYTQSDLYDGNGKWRPVVVGDRYNPSVSADAVINCLWLANHATNPATAARLRDAFTSGTAQLLVADPVFNSGTGHIRWPIANLLLGRIPENLAGRLASGLNNLALFDTDGIRHYIPTPGGTDYGSTHYADHANGYSASALEIALESAVLTGDANLAAQAIAMLDKQTALYADTVPRGAQTWEMPLHTPDILASAKLVHCYTLGYQLTGRKDLLEQAKYWAWTGVPFVYLDRSTGGAIGDYATIAVLGSSNWIVPCWIGSPVQWCGIVYAAWIERLAPLDPTGPWSQLAHGITVSGLQQSFPFSDASRRGLLPDSFTIKSQTRNNPAINPGTVMAGMPGLYGQARLCDFHRAAVTHWMITAPSPIRVYYEGQYGVTFTTRGWGDHPYSVLIANARFKPRVILTGPPGTPRERMTVPDVDYRQEDGWLILNNLVRDRQIVVQ
ncbi:MAG: hypothetical protein M1457_03715, partial [bacterium]|nr:hypothetical protein [bacterium]